MKKLINRPNLLTLLLLALALLMPHRVWGQDTFVFSSGNNQDGSPIVVNAFEANFYGDNSFPTLYNADKLEVSVSSSNEGVATVNYEGEQVNVTLEGLGTTTITAVGQRGTTSVSASYELTVSDLRDDFSDYAQFGPREAAPVTSVSTTYGTAPEVPTLVHEDLPDAIVTYSSSETSVATVNNSSGEVTVKGAGTTIISASFGGNVFCKPGSVSYTLTVSQKEVGLTWGTVSFTYDGSAHVPTATATGLVGADACTVTVDGAQTNAGSYTATASALSNANYKLPAANTTTFTIAKAASSLTTAPTAKTLTYTGSAQALVNAGTASGGTLQYSLDNQTYVEAIPTGTNVGNYTVYYKVVGDANHEDAAGSQVTVTIAKATPTVTFSAAPAPPKGGES